MTQNNSPYIPALSFKWLTPLYDTVLKRVMREETFKRRLIVQAQFGANQRVLDLGCGTGTLTLMIKRQYPYLELTGIDGDPQVLEIARRKAIQANASIQWDLGMANDLPYESDTFDRIVSSLMTHHLTSENKLLAFKEVFRVLKPGGEFHIADFGAPHSPTMKFVVLYMSKLEEAADNMKGFLPITLKEAGFIEVAEKENYSTLFGPLSLYKARKLTL
jgi:ubiquinone/menaquinone biosynthesis C-methylase UbiE